MSLSKESMHIHTSVLPCPLFLLCRAKGHTGRVFFTISNMAVSTKPWLLTYLLIMWSVYVLGTRRTLQKWLNCKCTCLGDRHKEPYSWWGPDTPALLRGVTYPTRLGQWPCPVFMLTRCRQYRWASSPKRESWEIFGSAFYRGESARWPSCHPTTSVRALNGL